MRTWPSSSSKVSVVASTFASGQSCFANKLSSVRYLSTRTLRSDKDIDLTIGKPLPNLTHEYTRFSECSRRLSSAYVTVSVIGCMAQILHDVQIPGEERRIEFSSACKFV